MRIKNLKLITMLIFGCVYPSYGEEFSMENKVIKAKISYQNLNRLSVKGDKIDSILGVDNAFHLEKNDKTGDAFIRPTEDNGYAPISLSLVTMSGKTQDLLLEPVDGEANSIELISKEENQPVLPDFPEENTSGDYEESVSAVMKKFINASSERNGIVLAAPDREHGCLSAEFETAYRIDGVLCLRFSVKTSEKGQFVLDERMFSQEGDIALSLSNLRIREAEKVTLYVLRKK